MSGSNGHRPPAASGGSRRSPLERPTALKGTNSAEEVQRYLNELVSLRVLGEDPSALARDVALERGADQAEDLQKRSVHADPDRHRGGGGRPKDLNRHLRRVRARKKRLAKAVAAMVERARAEGDPDWKPEAFPALDWRIEREVWAILRDVSGRKARAFAAALPPAQAQQLVEEAESLAVERELSEAEAYATMRWRELVAGAWASWRLSRPVRARKRTEDDGRKRLGAYALGHIPPDPEEWKPPVVRENPWKGGRVVDGYARQAFCLLMRSVATGQPMSISKLFYRNGSGEQGVFGYLATPAPSDRKSGLPRIDGVLGLYTRFQPRADKSKYVGPVKRGADGAPLLDRNGHVQRYALCEHWYHRSMCGRRTAAQADRGQGESRSLIATLCPWLFDAEDRPGQLLEDSEARADSVDGDPETPSPAQTGDEPATEPGSRAPPD